MNHPVAINNNAGNEHENYLRFRSKTDLKKTRKTVLLKYITDVQTSRAERQKN